METTLANTLEHFWLYWLGNSYADTETLKLLVLASTIGFVWALIVKPVCWCFGIGRKKKND